MAAIAGRLAEAWPDAVVELDHANAYQLLVATILAAQSTDKLINTVTPALFAKYPDASALARADPAELEPMIFSTGFYRMKAKHLIGMAQAVVERHGGQVPETMEALVELPGVARKTANVVLGCALGKNEGIVVDTHVSRLAPRLGLTRETEPEKIEQDLMAQVPRDQWSIFAHRMIWHGRRVCHAKKPDCDHCTLAPLCPSAALAGAPAPPQPGPSKSARRRLGALAAAVRRGGEPDGKPDQAGKPAKASAGNGKPGNAGKASAASGKPGNIGQPAAAAHSKSGTDGKSAKASAAHHKPGNARSAEAKPAKPAKAAKAAKATKATKATKARE